MWGGKTTFSWEQRKLGEIYDDVWSGNRLPKDYLVVGDTPFIVAQTKNNGVCAYVSNAQKDYNGKQMKLFPANSVTFSIDNPEAIFVQYKPFFTSNIMRVLYNKELKTGSVVALSEMLKSLTQFYNWSFKFSGPVVMDSDISVPIQPSGQIDYEELDKIGDYLKSISNLITLHQREPLIIWRGLC